MIYPFSQFAGCLAVQLCLGRLETETRISATFCSIPRFTLSDTLRFGLYPSALFILDVFQYLGACGLLWHFFSTSYSSHLYYCQIPTRGLRLKVPEMVGSESRLLFQNTTAETRVRRALSS